MDHMGGREMRQTVVVKERDSARISNGPREATQPGRYLPPAIRAQQEVEFDRSSMKKVNFKLGR